ncbi:family 3 extracellular solute-binding protein [Oleiphilus messinensis]|uniref:Family 3 extracellular solute-binding protein n=1 Tax=Oleiphilus messinensis TaxID=141451 RepID=A0A1Y0I6V9_9GAMM|nr:transporter substrate-binding domain-containing protein [Oleiphilus messinensis]ARU56238.1 family 3 extracellular solute-binding protein [Oleiphilus messinensis]
MLALCFCFALPASAADIILKAGLPAFPPFAYPDEATERGVVVDIYKMLEKELKVKIDIKYYPYPRVVRSMRNGDLDVAIIFKNDTLSSDVTYVGEVSKSKVVIIPRKGVSVDCYEDLYKLNDIAVVRRANYEPRFDSDSKLNKVPVLDYVLGMRMMMANRMDAIIGSQSGLQETIHTIGSDWTALGEPFLLSEKEWWVHLSRKSPHQELAPIIKKKLEAIYKKDLVWELYAQSKRAPAQVN